MKKTILFNDFKKEYLEHKSDFDSAINRVLMSGIYILGDELRNLEKALAELLRVDYCVGVGNGTDAITISLLALGIGPGDEVITTNLTAYPTITGIERSGATPVVVDIDETSGLIDPTKIEPAITPRTKAIVPVHLYGQSCDMDSITAIAIKHKLKIIEDCAQSIMATYKGKFTGSIGDVGTLSFYPTKNLGAIGDGGAVVTKDYTVFKRLVQLRNYGQTVRYHHDIPGLNSRLDEIQAAILLEKIKYLEHSIEKRRQIANYYHANIKLLTLSEKPGNFHTYHLYVLKSTERDRLMKYLSLHGINNIIHYPIPVSRQKAFERHISQGLSLDLKVSERFSNEVLSIPVNPEMSVKEMEYVVHITNGFDH